MSVAEMEEKMRHLEIPIIPRTINDSICLDVRTIERKDYKMIAAELAELLGKKEEDVLLALCPLHRKKKKNGRCERRL